MFICAVDSQCSGSHQWTAPAHQPTEGEPAIQQHFQQRKPVVLLDDIMMNVICKVHAVWVGSEAARV